MEIELKRIVRKIYEDTKEEDIEFELIFTPKNVEETLKLKELEEVRRSAEIDGFYHDKWEDLKFIICLS